MKKILLSFAAASLFALNMWAQAPQSFNYQAVVRNNTGTVVANQTVSARFTIRDGSSSGNTVYQETKSLTTNQFGLTTHAIGTGTVANGSFAGINWGSGSKWLQVEVDAAGGSNYTDMGTSQLLSVPYALFAANGGGGGTTYNAGNGIDIQGTTISNTMPDQQVNITNGSGISISGGYPNFTITNSQPDQQVNISGGTGVSVSGSYPNFTISSSGGGGSLSGSGTSNYIPKWTSSSALGNSLLRDNGSVVYIGSQNGTNQLEINISGKDAIAGKTTGSNNGVYGVTTGSGSAVYGNNSGSGPGVKGVSSGGDAIYGLSSNSSYSGVYGRNTSSGTGVTGESTSGKGVQGIGSNYGVFGTSASGIGVSGVSTSSSSGAYGVYGESSTFASGYGVRGYSNSTNGNGVAGLIGSGGSGNSYGVWGVNNNTTTGYAGYFNGRLAYTAGLINASDGKLKQNIQPLNRALVDILQLRPSTYEFEEKYTSMALPQGRQCGFIAQELEKVFPNLVERAFDKTNENEILEYKGVNYVGLIPYLIKAIQEQQELINALQQKVDSTR